MFRSTIIGNLTADPVFNTTPAGRQVANFTVAENFTTRNGERFTTYVRASLWGDRTRLAENLHKGDKVLLDGRLKASVYRTADGQYRANLEMSEPHLEYLSSKRVVNDQLEGSADDEVTY